MSLKEAIRWSIRSGQLHNADSARVSMPAQLVRVPASVVAAKESAQLSDVLSEDQAEEAPPPARATNTHVYTWRVDLSKTGKTYKWGRKGAGAKSRALAGHLDHGCGVGARAFSMQEPMTSIVTRCLKADSMFIQRVVT